MNYHQLFVEAIHKKQILRVIMNSKEKGIITRSCTPLDFGPHKRFPDKGDRYMLYHLETEHPSPMLPSQIVKMELTTDKFEPKDIITWDSPYDWHIHRDWGLYS